MTWNTSFQHLLACKVSFEKSADSLMGIPLYVSSIFWQFWLFFVFKFVVFLLLVVRGCTMYLPTPPSQTEGLVIWKNKSNHGTQSCTCLYYLLITLHLSSKCPQTSCKVLPEELLGGHTTSFLPLSSSATHISAEVSEKAPIFEFPRLATGPGLSPEPSSAEGKPSSAPAPSVVQARQLPLCGFLGIWVETSQWLDYSLWPFRRLQLSSKGGFCLRWKRFQKEFHRVEFQVIQFLG